MQTNNPSLWQHHLPTLQADGHKYDRGHTLVIGSPLEGSGATKLVATSALRSGAGLVTVTADQEQPLMVYAASFASIMVKLVTTADALIAMIHERNISSVVIGSGNGASHATLTRTKALLAQKTLPIVLDADALNVFRDKHEELCRLTHAKAVLTPHEGEFSRLFGHLSGNREERALEAARQTDSIIILKGAETLIADPDGMLVVNDNAPPYLATAGAGDVLAGILGGLLAQGMTPFNAACAAVWIHGACANHHQRGMISEDLVTALPAVMTSLYNNLS